MGSEAIVNGGQRLQYVDHGGDGPVVVALHSFLMDGEMFRPQLAELGDRFRFITVDGRGHGGTPAGGPFSYWDVARDVLGLLDELGIGRAAVMGTSQGGFVGLRMALLAPDRVAALVLLGTSAAAEDVKSAAHYRQLRDTWVTNGPVEGLLDMVATICLGDTPAAEWKAKWRAVDGARFAPMFGHAGQQGRPVAPARRGALCHAGAARLGGRGVPGLPGRGHRGRGAERRTARGGRRWCALPQPDRCHGGQPAPAGVPGDARPRRQRPSALTPALRRGCARPGRRVRSGTSCAASA